MEPTEVKALLAEGLEHVEIEVNGDGRHFEVRVVSAIFAGKRPVQRQQLVYAVLNNQISAGTIHAVNMTTLTPEEAAG